MFQNVQFQASSRIVHLSVIFDGSSTGLCLRRCSRTCRQQSKSEGSCLQSARAGRLHRVPFIPMTNVDSNKANHPLTGSNYGGLETLALTTAMSSLTSMSTTSLNRLVLQARNYQGLFLAHSAWAYIGQQSPCIPLFFRARYFSSHGRGLKERTCSLARRNVETKTSVPLGLSSGGTPHTKSKDPCAPRTESLNRNDEVQPQASFSLSSSPLHYSSSRNWAQAWYEQIKSIPNIITTCRILSAPVIGYLICLERYEVALGGCVLAALSDGLDGYIAKTFPEHATVLGTFLDPLADKIFIAVISVSLAYQSLLPIELVALWITKDLALVGGSYYYVQRKTKEGDAVTDPSRTPLRAEPTMISKVNTLLQFSVMTFGMTLPICGLPPHTVFDGLCWVTAVTTSTSGLSYVGGASLIPSGNRERSGGS